MCGYDEGVGYGCVCGEVYVSVWGVWLYVWICDMYVGIEVWGVFVDMVWVVCVRVGCRYGGSQGAGVWVWNMYGGLCCWGVGCVGQYWGCVCGYGEDGGV